MFGDSIGSVYDVKGSVDIISSSKDRKISNLSDCLVDLESGIRETKSSLAKTEKDCRICHLSLWNQESGVPIELGCSCMDDLAAAHKDCAETWFKVKGNKPLASCNSSVFLVLCRIRKG